ncbi:TolC family protein [uncultured Roseivirga sp.]|uniref:TolC family protein n=1 Tax=uncultured Roseivirga sp. TaxID=543088 RepID=UPI0030D7D545|tara:strand:+ start:1510 stop:3021 length:1512 start_codon:yes stop_codon:yes gene_type:complete
MKKVILLSLLFIGLAQVSFSQEKRVLTLEEVIQLARQNSRSAKRAQTQRTLGYWSYNVYKSQLKPQLLLRGTLPNYTNRSIPVPQPDGTIDFVSVNQNNSTLGLGLEQILPWTNTTVSFESNLARFDNFSDDNKYYQGDPVGVSITQPLFTVNQFKWDKKTEPLRYEQSKRSYVQDMEQASQTAANLFFRLLVEQKNLQIALQNAQKNDTVFKVEQGRYNIGTSTEDQLLQTELDLLTSRSDAQQAQLDVQSLSLELRNFIGLTENVDLELIAPMEVAVFDIDYETALQYAKDNRAEYLDFQLQRLEAQRNVATARASRFNASISASYGFSSLQKDNLGEVYMSEFNAPGSLFRLNFNVPILDGGRNKARMNEAYERQKLTEFTVDQSMITFEQEISNAVRNFKQIIEQIELAKKSEEIALKRFEITNGRYLAGKVDILTLTNARSGKDQAIRSYVSALQQYWDAYYELRTLTLYDFKDGVLLYNELLEYDPKTDSIIEKAKQ